MIVCYPNPTGSVFMLAFLRDDTSRVDVRFVNSAHELAWSVDSIMVNQYVFPIDSPYAQTGELVRIYWAGDKDPHCMIASSAPVKEWNSNRVKVRSPFSLLPFRQNSTTSSSPSQ